MEMILLGNTSTNLNMPFPAEVGRNLQSCIVCTVKGDTPTYGKMFGRVIGFANSPLQSIE